MTIINSQKNRVLWGLGGIMLILGIFFWLSTGSKATAGSAQGAASSSLNAQANGAQVTPLPSLTPTRKPTKVAPTRTPTRIWVATNTPTLRPTSTPTKRPPIRTWVPPTPTSTPTSLPYPYP